MNHRDRLLTALNHQEPDRVPIDLASTQVTGISRIAYENLRRYLGLPEQESIICDAIQQIVLPHDDVYEKFTIDTRGLWPKMNHTEFTDQDDGNYLSHVDDWNFHYRRHKENGLWYDLYKHPLGMDNISLASVTDYKFPKGDTPERIAGLRQQAEEIKNAGYAVVLKSICAGLFEMHIRIRGMQNAMLDLMIDHQTTGMILDGILQHKLDYWDMALTELGDVIDVIAEADDFGTQTSQLISVETWRDIIKPRQVELVRTMRQKAPHAKIFFHSCGNIRPFLPEFIEMGIDIINPVHITADGMDPKQLKKDFGNDIVFWGGGIDTQDTLPNGSRAHVKDAVKRNLDTLAPGGGFVFNTIHNIQADVPPDNLIDMFETVLEYGIY